LGRQFALGNPPEPPETSGQNKESREDPDAELTIRPEEIRDALETFVQSYQPDAASREEVGTVQRCRDASLRSRDALGHGNELLRFEDGTLGLALTATNARIGVILSPRRVLRSIYTVSAWPVL